MKLGHLGRNSALKAKKTIKDKLEKYNKLDEIKENVVSEYEEKYSSLTDDEKKELIILKGKLGRR